MTAQQTYEQWLQAKNERVTLELQLEEKQKQERLLFRQLDLLVRSDPTAGQLVRGSLTARLETFLKDHPQGSSTHALAEVAYGESKPLTRNRTKGLLTHLRKRDKVYFRGNRWFLGSEPPTGV